MEVLASRTIIHPSDLARSLAFYGEQLGLAVAREFGAGDRRGVVFYAGNGLVEVVGARDGAAPESIALWLQVRSVARTVAELDQRGVPIVRGPQLEPWGLVEAWLADPDGLRIHLVEVPDDHPLRRDTRTITT